MPLVDKYQSYLVNHCLDHDNPSYLDLSAEGWKLLIKENLTPRIEKCLNMRQLNDYIWANDYSNGKRKVLSFFLINPSFATLKWGWNFDFVPKCSGNKAVFARTDKSITTHIFELSQDFYDVGAMDIAKRAKREKTIFSKTDIKTNDIETGLGEKIKQHLDVFDYLLPLILEYYRATDTYQSIIDRIDHNMQNSYYHFINSDSLISKAFIEKRLGMMEKASMDFEAIPFCNEKNKNEFYKKFISL